MKKMTNNKGFTLMEMLIVVAIIAILIAVAIPTFTNSLTKAREATDMANVRATYADIVMKNMLDGTAIPQNKAGFVTEIGKVAGKDTGKELNYADKLTVTTTTAGEDLTIVYACSATENTELKLVINNINNDEPTT